MMSAHAIDEDRRRLRERIASFEEELRRDQWDTVPSQIGIVMPVPSELGRYTDAELELIKTFESEAREACIAKGIEPDPRDTLSKALARFNLKTS
ncbi:hypothetical protein IT407_03350 [Candidatus Uhrbacteria bacterium]|nr:hypothetical protein [Candidatus Uhrbacteria bacterium]